MQLLELCRGKHNKERVISGGRYGTASWLVELLWIFVFPTDIALAMAWAILVFLWVYP